MAYLIGQFLGLLVPIFTITVPFWKKKWQILACAIAVNALMVANLLLIGQFGSAAFLCLVAVVQSAVSIGHSTKGTKVGLGEAILFTVLYLGFGFLGIFTAPGISCPADVPDGSYRIMLRPDCLNTDVPGDYAVTVEEISFRGSDTLVSFRAEDGTLMRRPVADFLFFRE